MASSPRLLRVEGEVELVEQAGGAPRPAIRIRGEGDRLVVHCPSIASARRLLSLYLALPPAAAMQSQPPGMITTWLRRSGLAVEIRVKNAAIASLRPGGTSAAPSISARVLGLPDHAAVSWIGVIRASLTP